MSNIKSIGDILKEKRENTSLSQEEVSNETGIKIENIKTLESNNFADFPNKVYARAFLRDYANFLALNSTYLLERFESEYATSETLNGIDEDELEKEVSESIQKEPSKEDYSGFGKIIVSFVIFMILVGIAYGIHLKTNTKPKITKNVPTTKVTQSTKKVTFSQKPSANNKTSEHDKYPKGVTLKVGTFNDCWIRVVVDGNVEYLGILPKGVNKTFYGQNYVKIRAGDAGKVQIRVNGQLKDDLGKVGNPISKIYYY